MMDANAVSLLVSVVALIGTFATVVRLFTKTEVRLDVVDEKTKETALLARTTADNFNGPARAEHEKLVGRVAKLEENMLKTATMERVDALAAEVRQGFRHLEDVIKREMRDREDG